MNLKMILAALGLAASMGTARMAHAAEPFVKGLETCFTYVPATESDAGKSGDGGRAGKPAGPVPGNLVGGG